MRSEGALASLPNPDLSTNPTSQCTAARAQATVKERCKALNGAIVAIHESQSGWTVPDATLRANLKARTWLTLTLNVTSTPVVLA